MKRFLTRAGAKIGRFFWSWGFLKFVLWAVTIIIFFYVEEDWRGARAWAATKTRWEAMGESFDLNKLTPPPIPDDQNLAAIPLFKLKPVTQGDMDRESVALQKAMRTGPFWVNNLPEAGNSWMSGKLPDMEKIRLAMAAHYEAVFKGAELPKDALAQFDILYPFLSDLRAAAATRPLCRFDEDYFVYPPASRSLWLLTDQIQLSKILTLHAVLSLDHHQPDLALEDIKLNYTLLSAVKRDPSLVAGLVAIGMVSISHEVLYDGLALHAWNDAQLVEIDHTLQPVNFLANYQFAMRSEAAESALDIEYIKHAPRAEPYGYVYGTSDRDVTPGFWNNIPSLWPSGWWDQNKSLITDADLNNLASVDLKTSRVLPDKINELEKQLQEMSTHIKAPWNVLYYTVASYLPGGLSKFAYSQARIDEARIACALERYRLAHGVYPGALDALVPAYIDELPHDVMNGDPYHYQLRPDGTFLLYSVGWNQKDDGGKIVFQKGSPSLLIDNTQGDWVWPTPQLNP